MRCEKCGAYVEYGEHLCEVCKCMEKIINDPKSMYKEEEKFEIIDLDDAISQTLDLTLPTTQAMESVKTPVKKKHKFNFSMDKSKISFAGACFTIVFCLVMGSIGYTMSFSTPKNIYATFINNILDIVNNNLYLGDNSEINLDFSSNISNINEEYPEFYNLFSMVRLNGKLNNNYDIDTYKVDFNYVYKYSENQHIYGYIINDEEYIASTNYSDKYVYSDNNFNFINKFIYNTDNKKLLYGLNSSINEYIKDASFEEESVILTIDKEDVLTNKISLFISQETINTIKYNYYKYIKKYSLYSELSNYMNVSETEVKNIILKYLNEYDASSYDTKAIYYISLYVSKEENIVNKIEFGTTDLYDSKIIEIVIEKENLYKIKYIKNSKLFISGDITINKNKKTTNILIDLVDINKNTLVFNLSYNIKNNIKFNIESFSTTNYESLTEEEKEKVVSKQILNDITNFINKINLD
jgi:hypothetical protein